MVGMSGVSLRVANGFYFRITSGTMHSRKDLRPFKYADFGRYNIYRLVKSFSVGILFGVSPVCRCVILSAMALVMDSFFGYSIGGATSRGLGQIMYVSVW